MTGKIDNRYEMIKPLGSGLSGEVLAVKDEFGSKALKFLKKVQLNVSKEEALTAFKGEFSILTELNHPGIARILDFGLDSISGKYYFTSELIEGKDFYAVTEGKSFEVIEDLIVQVLRALNYLHSRGIYHLDIKPQNILVGQKDNQLVSKIIDFGLAGFTTPRKKVGTPAYMAPEVILGGSLDGRTDLYSLGVLLYKVLTRENPFVSKDVKETFERQRHLVPRAPSQVNPLVPKFWDQIVLRLIEKKPSDRYIQPAHVIRDINFLANRNYEIETVDTRLSYIPEKGNLIGRKKEVEIFKSLFELIFVQENPNASRLLIIEGKTGTGKSRILSEFKYHSQLNNVPVYNWNSFKNDKPLPPFCLQIDSTDKVGPDQVNLVLHQYANEKILILWGTEMAPLGWTHSEKISLKNFSEEDLTQYLSMVTGLQNPPHKLTKEIYQRSDGNPLFVTELLRTLLVNNLLLDSSGRWISSTFEDIGVNFEKIQVPHTLQGLLKEKYLSLKPQEKTILEWFSIFNHSMDLQAICTLSHIQQPQASLLNLTKEDLIEKTSRESHYYFINVLMREVIYQDLSLDKKRQKHDEAAIYLEKHAGVIEECLLHQGRGSDDHKAIKALISLGDRYLKEEKFADAVSILEEAWERAQGMDQSTQIEVQTKLAESTLKGRYYNKAIIYYKNLKEIYDQNGNLPQAKNQQIQIYEKLGDIHSKLGSFDAAFTLFNTALKWLDQIDNSQVRRMIILNHIGNVYMKSGQLEKSEAIFRENYEIWERDFSTEEKNQVTNNLLSDVLILKKDFASAMQQIEKDMTFFGTVGNNYLMTRACYQQGDVLFQQMMQKDGQERLQIKLKAIKAFEEMPQNS